MHVVTDRDYNRLSDISYWVDAKKGVPFHPKKGQILDSRSIKGISQSYQILKVEDNQKDGMKAMTAGRNKNYSIFIHLLRGNIT
jgi:hypothetical protein